MKLVFEDRKRPVRKTFSSFSDMVNFLRDNVDSLANQNIIELRVTNDDIRKEPEKFSSH